MHPSLALLLMAEEGRALPKLLRECVASHGLVSGVPPLSLLGGQMSFGRLYRDLRELTCLDLKVSLSKLDHDHFLLINVFGDNFCHKFSSLVKKQNQKPSVKFCLQSNAFSGHSLSCTLFWNRANEFSNSTEGETRLEI